MSLPIKIDPKLDLVLERTVDISAELIFKAWTDPKNFIHWFCPKPWSATCEKMELHPGGAFETTMMGPNGERFNNTGCMLEIVPNKKLVWTSAMLPNFRPIPVPENGAGLLFTAFIFLEAKGNSTKYTAVAVHQTEEGCKQHKDMGFNEGWGVVLDQLVAFAKRITNKGFF